MKTARLWMAAAVLLPVAALAQEKYTNADLARLAPKRDAYTNADLARLAPLKMQARPIAPLAQVPVAGPSAAELDRANWLADRTLNRDLVVAEIDYWEGIVKQAHTALTGGRNEYPHVGSDTAEAAERIKILRRILHMIDAEIGLVR